MGLGPIPAIQELLKNTGMTMSDIDVVEINEAFAAQIVPCKEELGIPDEKLNPFGGAIALGHPFGMTGARIMTTLLNDLETLDGTYGIESMCVAGGMGMAMLVERLREVAGRLSRERAAVRASARRHPQRAVEPDRLAVEHPVLDDVARQLRVLRRLAEALGEGHAGAELLARLLGQRARAAACRTAPGRSC